MSSDVEAEFGPRLSATVVMATSEDDGFPASSLERHTARTRGWHTNKMPEFPVELGFAFDGLAEIRCLRLLAHESKIPSKVDLFVFTPTDDQISAQQYPPFESADFRRLGYLSFVQNESRNFSARELKTVRIKARVLYLKLVVRGCHSNGVNLFNQAGLVGCDFHGQLLAPFGKSARQVILGLPIDASIDAEVELTDLTPAKAPSSATGASRSGAAVSAAPSSTHASNAPSTANSRPQSAHSRNPNFDAITAQRIKQLTLHKSKAVNDEDYDLAKALKAQIDQLSAVGEKIFELEQRKRDAVDNEDYDVAKMLKRQIDQLRQPQAPQHQHQAPAAAPPAAAQHHHQPPPAQDNPYYDAGSDPTNAHSTDGTPHFQQAAVGNDDVPVGGGGNAAPPVAFDDIPAVARGGGAPPPEYPPAYPPPPAGSGASAAAAGNDDKVAMASGGANDETGGIVVTGKPAAKAGATVPVEGEGMPVWERQINEKIVLLAGSEEGHAPPLDAPKLKEYQTFTDAFGLYCCSCLFAKRWQLRDAALRAIVSPDGFGFLTSGVRPPNQGSAATVLQALLSYLDAKTTGVSDSISQVFFTVCDVIKAIVSDDLQGAPVVAAVHGLATLLPALMLKAGDSNQRVREKAQTTLFMLAMSPVGPERVAAAGLHDPQKGQKKPLNYRVHSARLSLVRVLVAKVGLNRKEQRTGLTAENVTKGLCVPLLSHASGDVRDAAVGLIVLLHEHVMDSVMQKLLGDVKPLQLQAIEEQLANTRQNGGGGSKPSATNDKQPELASSSISVERGGRHPVLDAARAAGGGTKDEVSAPAAGPKSTKQRQEEEREAAERAAKTCQFCGRHDPKFTDDLLDEHYARACPMLIACPLCQQVTEIPTLQQHLIGECNRATAVRQCPTCREAVPVAEFDEHVAASACIPHSPQYNVCPLCHEKLPPTEQGWDDHLLKAPGCANNARPYDGAGASEL